MSSPGGGAPPPSERADAAANRRRILDAASVLFAKSNDPGAITMGDLARASGVGRATLYRKFPDVAAVAVALLNEHETRIQQLMMSGPPPLGPGAPPAQRLAAFYVAMVGLLDRHLKLVLGAETGALRFRTGAYGAWRLHVRSLLIAADTPDPDAWIDVLLAPLAPESFRHQREVRGITADQIAAVLTTLAHAVLDPAREAW